MLPHVHLIKMILWNASLIFILQHHKVQPKCLKKDGFSLWVQLALAKPKFHGMPHSLSVRLGFLPCPAALLPLTLHEKTPISVHARLNSYAHQFLLPVPTVILFRVLAQNSDPFDHPPRHWNPTGTQLFPSPQVGWLVGSSWPQLRSLIRHIYTYIAKHLLPSSGKDTWFNVPFQHLYVNIC